jgi:hypothetical protein
MLIKIAPKQARRPEDLMNQKSVLVQYKLHLISGTLLLFCPIIGFETRALAAEDPVIISSAINCNSKKLGAANKSGGGSSQPSLLYVESAQELSVGERRVIDEVCPQAKFFSTQILLTPGATYKITSEGKWKDGQMKPVGPEGWWFLPLHPFNRIPFRNMFILSGSVGASLKHAFIIGRDNTWTAPATLRRDRVLMLFPNDWDSKYGNNRSLSPLEGGPLRVTVTRIS